jgi:hypothetical protein
MVFDMWNMWKFYAAGIVVLAFAGCAARTQPERLSEEPGSASAPSQVPASSAPGSGAGSTGGRYIGPRGGCYKLTKSGKKNYGAC